MEANRDQKFTQATKDSVIAHTDINERKMKWRMNSTQTNMLWSRQLTIDYAEWKNSFSFEIFGRLGKLEITGLGGSYGVERLIHYQMLPEMGPPPTTMYEYPMADNSWETEVSEFLKDIQLGRAPNPGIDDAQAALVLVEQLYAGSHSWSLLEVPCEYH